MVVVGMNYLELEKFNINTPDKLKVKEKYIGENKNKIIIIDNLFEDPEYVRDYALNAAYMPNTPGLNLSGNVVELGFYQDYYLTFCNFIIQQFYGKVDDKVNPTITFQRYDLSKKVLDKNLFPHIDDTSYASVTSLNHDDELINTKSGTSFYQFIPTKEESSKLFSYRFERTRLYKNKQIDFDYEDLVFEDFQMYHLEEHKFNRMIFYESNLFHSAYFHKKHFEVDRLTFNCFI